MRWERGHESATRWRARTAASLWVSAVVLGWSLTGCQPGPRPEVEPVVAGRERSPIAPAAVDHAPGGSGADPGRGAAAVPLERRVADAHRAAEEAFRTASSISASVSGDVDLLSLAQTTAEPMLQRRIDLVSARRRRGWVAVTPTDSAARDEVVAVTRVDAATADVEVCMLDDDLLVDTTTGAVVNAEVGIHRQRHRFVERDGVWRLAERETLASGADAGCFR